MFGSGVFKFWNKQKRLKLALKSWNKSVFRDVFKAVREAEEEVVYAEKEF